MEKIILLCLCFGFVLLLKLILKINFKKAKELEQDKELQNITDRFPKNDEIAREMLEIIDNKDVKIEEQKNTKTSLYIVATNKILISDLKDNYGRIGTIAHECMHSVQDKTLLFFNFLYSNFVLLYWIVSIVLLLCSVWTNVLLQLIILLLLLFIQTIIRAYLETDAMMKSIKLSNDYIEKKKLCNEQEKNILIEKYKLINDMGIRFYIFNLTSNSLIKLISVILISFFVK